MKLSYLWKTLLFLFLLFSGWVQAQNILILTTRSVNANAGDPEANYINGVVNEFAAPFTSATCSTTPQTGTDPISGLPKTVTCNHTELVNGVAMSSTIFDPGYDLVVVASAYTTIDAADWPVLQQAIQSRKARGILLFVDTINTTNSNRMVPLINATMGLSGGSAVTLGANIVPVFDSALNTAATGASDFSTLNPFRLCANCSPYNNTPFANALYLSQGISGPVSSGTTNAVGVLIPQAQSYPSAPGAGDGVGACVFVANDIGWGRPGTGGGWEQDQGKVGSSFLRSFNNATGPCTSPASTAAELKITKTTAAALPVPPVNGGTITYYVDVENVDATAIATNVGVTDSQPAGLSFGAWSCSVLTSGTPAAVCPSSLPVSGSLNTTIASLPPNGKLRFAVTATITDAKQNNSNTATVVPPLGATCQNSQCSSTVTLPGAAELTVTKTTTATTLTPGGNIAYTIIVSNTGSVAASSILVSDPVATGISSQTWTCAGAACPAGSGSGAISQTIASLPAGGNVTYTLNAIASASPPANVTNTVTASASNTLCASTNAPAPCTASATVPPLPVIQLTKAATNQPSPGSPIAYTVTVSNTSAVAANGSVVSDPLASGVAGYAWACSASGGAVCPNASGSGAITETVAVFPGNSAVTYQITATPAANPPTSITNVATVTVAGSGLCTPGNTVSPCIASATSLMARMIPVPMTGHAALVLLAVLLAACALLCRKTARAGE